MKSSTAKQRAKIYRLTAKTIANEGLGQPFGCCSCDHGACCFLKNLTGISFDELSKTFEEFFIFKPDDRESSWWMGGEPEPRIIALLFAEQIALSKGTGPSNTNNG